MNACGKRCTISDLVAVADLYYSSDRLAQCEKQCKEILAVERDCFWARTTLGLVYSQTERCHEAIEIAKTAMGNGVSNDASAYYVMAVSHEYLGQYDEAAEICEKALALNTNFNAMGIWSTLTRVHTKSGNAEKALAAVKEILARFPGEPYILYYAFLAVNKFEQSVETEQELIRMLRDTNQKREFLYFCRGLLAEKKGNPEEAYRMYSRARAENMLEPELRKHVSEFEDKYPEVVKRASVKTDLFKGDRPHDR